MTKKYVGSVNRGPATKPIARSEIVEAQKHTKSNAAAARYLKVSYLRYRKYAKIYGLFDSHANPTGIGVNKGYALKPSSIALKDIFANKYPKYSLIRLKNRMIARNMLMEECSMCGFKEKRITDSKTPLIISFKNGKKDFAKENIQLLCYNCLFLTTGAPSVAYRGYIEKSFEEPEKIPQRWDIDFREADAVDIGEPEEEPDAYDDIRAEVMRELNRE